MPSGLCCGVMGPTPNGVIIAGGFNGNSNTADLIAYNAESGLWEMVSKSLSFARNYHVGVMIPDELASC